MSVTAVMLMGAKREPFLAACLASIRDAVDHLIVNDNSGLAEHANLSVMKESELYRSSRVTIVPSAFLGFGPCRDLCLAEMRKTNEPGRWIIFVDCDEVHIPTISRVTQRLLPNLPERIGIVDGYVPEMDAEFARAVLTATIPLYGEDWLALDTSAWPRMYEFLLSHDLAEPDADPEDAYEVLDWAP